MGGISGMDFFPSVLELGDVFYLLLHGSGSQGYLIIREVDLEQ